MATTTIHHDRVPAPVVALCETLQQRGFETYLVGGGVRDLLAGRVAKDWDVATAAPPDEVQRSFRRTIPTGLRHGTVTVLTAAGGPAVEVTTFRAEEGFSDGRRPDRVVFGVDLETDLRRRDFTINAMAIDPISGLVVDPHGGRADLAAGILRAVGDARQRFAEDGLRPLRALRFATALEFTIEAATLAAIPEALPVFLRVSGERVRDEFFKLLAVPDATSGLALLRQTGLLVAILAGDAAVGLAPDAGQATTVRWTAGVAACVALAPDPVLRLVPLAEAAAALGVVSAEAIAARLRLSRHDRERLVRAVHRARPELEACAPALLRRYARAVGRASLEDALALEEAAAAADPGRRASLSRWRLALDQVLSEAPPLELRDLAIDGAAVKERAARPPGPHLRRLLEALLDRVIERPELNEPRALLTLLDELLAEPEAPSVEAPAGAEVALAGEQKDIK
ncbi:MAG: CCA tRNA nucleotidyltransferase [Proteobacteria bacterium]|nr:CCA tRNA nucleotidyltransferase [Pseudomonadota bacterium]